MRRRTFKSELTQREYDGCMANRPKSRMNGIGAAFWWGYENPSAAPVSVRCGVPGSQARGAWAAGVDCRRADERAGTVMPSPPTA